MSEIVIIGSGIASRSFTKEYLKLSDSDEIVVITKDYPFPYSRMAILDVLKGEIGLENIRLDYPDNVRIETGKTASFIDADNKVVKTEDGEEIGYNRLIIATGASPRKYTFGSDMQAYTVRNMEDIDGMEKHLKKGENKVVLLGGGFVNMEVANALWMRGADVTMIVSSDRLLSRMLPYEISAFVRKKVEEKGINLITNTNVQGVRGNTVYLDNGGTVEADFMVIGKGVERNLIPVKYMGKTYKNYENDASFKTPFENVYIIGDAGITQDIITNKKRTNAIWPVAERQGRHLAQIFAGEGELYRGDVAYNMLSVFDMTVFVIGNLFKGTLKIYLKTGQSLYAVSEENGMIYGMVTINHPLPFARIIKRFFEHGYY